ncbi:C4b-binding protein alpha chain isoform X2 [Phocoena sinus]|uniref:C4b-binding protein alpha chain isoform X2 n=1 Tax=Phocoena sinus TaxID=42100 RepID=UPI0013C5272C|nr:C4b-binding protein alpha chain isoform X2 [Phocoena sinus]
MTESSSSATCRKVSAKQQRAPVMIPHRKGTMASWPFSGPWRVSDPILFQVTLVAALLATVLGNCGPPPYLQFASPINELNETEFETGATLKYSCRPGYSRTSSRSYFITCDSTGSWKYREFCVKKRCGNPGELLNGQVTAKTDYSFGSQIEFSCSEGYILTGSATSFCEIQDKGVGWSDPLPICEIVKCEPPPAISNGKHNGGDEDFYTYGSSVTYSCDPDFSMLGTASISCRLENKTIGVWNPSPPVCKKITCPQPVVNDGKIISGFGPIYTYKQTIVFDCNKGYRLKGNKLIHCGADNSWHPPPPICELNGCAGLPHIPHAMWGKYGYQKPTEEEVYDIGTELRYFCTSGYKPKADGPTTVTCQRNLEWTPYIQCEEVCCPVLELNNGRITLLGKSNTDNNCTYFYGDQISYTCPKKRTYYARCTEDGTWSPKTPECYPDCNSPPVIAHGHSTLNGPSLIFGKAEATYECDEGYNLVGKKKLSCTSSGWSPAAPQCKALCPKPEIEHGRLSVDKDRYVEPETVTVQCDSHYGLVGSQSITCSENRTWYPEVPKCEWEYPEGCEQVVKGKKLMQCLPNPEEVRLALEVYKMYLEIQTLELQKDEAEQDTQRVHRNVSHEGEENVPCCLKSNMDHFS